MPRMRLDDEAGSPTWIKGKTFEMTFSLNQEEAPPSRGRRSPGKKNGNGYTPGNVDGIEDVGRIKQLTQPIE